MILKWVKPLILGFIKKVKRAIGLEYETGRNRIFFPGKDKNMENGLFVLWYFCS